MSGQQKTLLITFGLLPVLVALALMLPLYSPSAQSPDLFGFLPRGTWSYVAVAVTICGYVIYIWQMFPAQGHSPAKPHPLSWVLFGFLTATGWVVQEAQGAQEGSWCLGVTAGFCFLIAGVSFWRFREDWRRSWADIDNIRLDIVVTILALILFVASLPTRYYTELATTSVIFAAGADFVSYLPTFKKAWNRPEEDSATNFAYNSIKCLPALLALGSYSFATAAYLVMLLIVNGFFSAFLLVWRKVRPAWRKHFEPIVAMPRDNPRA